MTRATITVELKTGVFIPADLVMVCEGAVLVKTPDGKALMFRAGDLVQARFGEDTPDA